MMGNRDGWLAGSRKKGCCQASIALKKRNLAFAVRKDCLNARAGSEFCDDDARKLEWKVKVTFPDHRFSDFLLPPCHFPVGPPFAISSCKSRPKGGDGSEIQ